MNIITDIGAKVTIFLAELFGFKEFANANRAAAVIVADDLNKGSEQYNKAKTRLNITAYIVIAAVLFAVYKFYKLIFLKK